MKKLCFLLLLALAGVSHAGDDGRIRTETYDKDRVYNVYTIVGRASLIQLEDDESLVSSSSSALGIGDAGAWNLGVRGNNIVLKPAQKFPRTNLIVVTNKRTYSFDLRGTPQHADPTYILRFRYPDNDVIKMLANAKRAQITAAAKGQKVTINTDYVWRGENVLLKPTAAYDDGRFTRLVYDNAGELPLFFKVLPDGSEALLNSNVDPEHGNTVVLHEVIRTVRARLGDQVIEIINRAYAQPKFNEDKTSVPGVVRVNKEAL